MGKIIVAMGLLAGLLCSGVARGANLEEVMLGWVYPDGYRVKGVFYNEGVDVARGDRGYQNDRADGGNSRHGKNCGGTAFGKTCRDNPNVDMHALTAKQALELYRVSEWAWIRGDEWASQYMAYLVMDLGTNLGKEEICILLRQFKNLHDGNLPDWKVNGAPLKVEEVAWFNAYTRSDVMEQGHQPRFPGDYAVGEHDSTRRQLMVSQLTNLGINRYATVSKNQKLIKFLRGWIIRVLRDGGLRG